MICEWVGSECFMCVTSTETLWWGWSSHLILGVSLHPPSPPPSLCLYSVKLCRTQISAITEKNPDVLGPDQDGILYMLVFQISHDFQLYILVAKTFLHPWCNFPQYTVGWMQSWKNLDSVLNLKSSSANNPEVMQNEFFTIKVTNFKDILNLENCQHYLDEIDVNYDGCDL